MAYVYIIKCRDNTYYTGYTVNIEKRLQEHNQGKGCRYTRGRNPVELVYLEVLENKSLAMQREIKIKNMKRNDKEKLFNIHDNKSSNI